MHYASFASYVYKVLKQGAPAQLRLRCVTR